MNINLDVKHLANKIFLPQNYFYKVVIPYYLCQYVDNDTIPILLLR